MMKKAFHLSVFATLVLFMPARSLAVTFTSETGAGAATFSQTLAADGDVGLGAWGWSVGYTLSRTSLSYGAIPGTAASTVIDNTHEVGGGISYVTEGAWGFDGALSFSTTPEEKLTSVAGVFGISYFVPLGKIVQAVKPASTPAPQLEIDESEPGDDDSEPFEAMLRLKATLGTRNYDQTLSAGTTYRRPGRAAQTTDAKNQIRQNALGLSARWTPHENWSVDLVGGLYSYDKDVATFTNQLDSPRALRLGSSATYNSDGGLPDWSATLAVGYWATDSVKTSVSTSQAALAINKSIASEVRAAVELDFTSTLRGIIGVEYMSSYVSYDTLGLIGFELAL